MKNMSKAEIKMLISMLEELSDVQGNAGCNDLFLPLTQDNIDFAKTYNASVEEDMQFDIRAKEIVGCDILVTSYFIKKLKSGI